MAEPIADSFRYVCALVFLGTIGVSCGASSQVDPDWERKMKEWQAFQNVCRAPPYSGPAESETLPEKTKYISCGDGHQVVLAWDGAREKGLNGAMKFAERHMKDLHEKYGLTHMGMGLCCDSDKAPPETRSYWCGRVEVVACSVTFAEFAKTIEELHAQDGPDAVPLALSIRVEGLRNKGPRCLPDDPKCGPTKTRVAKAYDPKLPREIIKNTGRGTCSHDGDCNPVGCEQEGCWAWQNGISFGECYDPPRTQPVPTYCGCVEGQCSLFSQ